MGNVARKYGGLAFSIGTLAIGAGALGGVFRGGQFLKGLALLGGSMLLGSSQRVQGAHLTETGIQLSVEGTEDSIGHGTNRGGGNVVWGKGIVEHSRTTRQGKGGPPVEEFTGTTSFMLKIGHGQITRLNRLKLNNYDVYDWNGGSEVGFTLTWDPAGFWYGAMQDGTKVRVYPGTRTQPVDSRIEAVEGVDEWTNYPNSFCIFFEDMPLEKYGNAPPNVTVEYYNSVSDVADVILNVAAMVKMPASKFDLSALAGLSVETLPGEGYLIDSRRSAADIINELCELFHFFLVEVDGVLRAVLRNVPRVHTFGEDELRIHSLGQEAPFTAFNRPDITTLPSVVENLTRNPDRFYQVGHSQATRVLAVNSNIESSSYSASLKGNHALQVARIHLAQRYAEARFCSPTAGLQYIWLIPGDPVGIPSPNGVRDSYLSEISIPLFGPLAFTCPERDMLAYSMPMPGDMTALDRRLPQIAGAPITFVSECVPLTSSRPNMIGPPGLIVATTQTKNYQFSGNRFSVERWNGTGWDELRDVDSNRSIIGELTSDFTPGEQGDGFDPAKEMHVKVYWGEVSSATLDAAKSRANLLMIEGGGLYSIVNATPGTTNDNGETTYTFDTIKSQRFTSGDLVTGTVAAGTRFVMLTNSEGRADANVQFVELTSDWIGSRMRIRAAALGTDPLLDSIQEMNPFQGQNVKEPKPLLLSVERDGGVRLQGRALTRYAEDTNNLDVTRMSALLTAQGYKFQIVLDYSGTERTWTKFETDPQATFNLVVTDSELTTAFGLVPPDGTIDGRIAIYGSFGPGRSREFENV